MSGIYEDPMQKGIFQGDFIDKLEFMFEQLGRKFVMNGV